MGTGRGGMAAGVQRGPGWRAVGGPPASSDMVAHEREAHRPLPERPSFGVFLKPNASEGLL